MGALIIVPATLGRSGRTRRRKRLILRANATYLTHLFQGIGRMDDQGPNGFSWRPLRLGEGGPSLP